ncbi:MAG: FAD-dependent oxidoreductase [Candidatus Korarchaeota archaeon]|nr:FAD-dependent oxidoreductase [Candidatus Korarchaeota archaeon]
MTALKLEKRARSLEDVRIVLIDRNNYHQYLHLSYQIITAVRQVSDLTIPISRLLQGKKIDFFQATVQEIDLSQKVVKTDRGDLPYDQLAIALGSEPNYYNIKGAEENSFSLSSIGTAVQIRDALRKTPEQGEEVDIVVGGGGFTGVELAGEIVEKSRCCVTIVEAAKTLLPSWESPRLSGKVLNTLTKMGLRIVLGRSIEEVKPNSITLSDGSQVECSLFVWAGGIQASSVASKSGLKTGRGNRVVIDEFCEAVGFPGVYVVGDCALVVDPQTGEVLPPCIEIALQQAEVVAKNMYADAVEAKRTLYVPRFSGLILAVGENYAIGRVFGVRVEGWLAKTLKRLTHLHYVYILRGLRRTLGEIMGD